MNVSSGSLVHFWELHIWREQGLGCHHFMTKSVLSILLMFSIFNLCDFIFIYLGFSWFFFFYFLN